jgi:copper/silver efflux system protein
MTVATMLLGLVPIMWATGTGSDVMKRIAAPVIGGILTSFVLELVVYPAVYEIWKWDVMLAAGGNAPFGASPSGAPMRNWSP